MKSKKELTDEELKIVELKECVAETNELYHDFGILKREFYEDWKDKNIIQLENHRKKVIHDFLNGKKQQGGVMKPMKKRNIVKKEKVIEQPCCGCIHFVKCGSVTKSAPFNCEKRITVDELGKFPTK